MSKLELPAGQDNVIVRNQEVYGYLPKDVIDRMGNTSIQLATEDQTALGAINELKSNLTEYETTASNNSIIYNKQGKRRLLTLNRASYLDVNTFINNLPSSERPITTAIAPAIRMRKVSNDYIYGTMSLIQIPNTGSIYVGFYLIYNANASNNGKESQMTLDDDLIVAQVEWYTT